MKEVTGFGTARFGNFSPHVIRLVWVRILIVKLGSIGDIVHTLPALAAIRRQIPTAEISWAVEKRSAEILRGNPMIDRLIVVDTKGLRAKGPVDGMLRNLRGQVSELRSSKFDVALDFQGLLKSAVVAKLSGARKRWGFGGPGLREPASRILLTNAVRIPPRTHIITKNLSLARSALKIALPKVLEFPLAVSAADRNEAETIISKAGARFAVLNPGGGWKTKLWEAANFGRLADQIWERLGMTSVIVSGPGEAALAEAALAASRTGKIVAARPGLKGFYELAGHASVYVGGDTGPTHLAVAAGTPVVGIFGPTEWWRNGSPDPRDICVERNDIGCRVDCHRRSCSNWICMDITVERVFDAVRTRLAAEVVTV